MIIYVLDPPSTMAYIIYTDMMLTWMSQGESVFWLFIQESDPWLHPIFHSHVSYSEKSPEDMYHVVPLYTFIKLSLLCCSILDGSLSIYIYVHIYIHALYYPMIFHIYIYTGYWCNMNIYHYIDETHIYRISGTIW